MPDWDVEKATMLYEAIQACQTLQELHDIGQGIKVLPDTVLSKERRTWLRGIYLSRKQAIVDGPYTDDHLTKKGKEFYGKVHSDTPLDEDRPGGRGKADV